MEEPMSLSRVVIAFLFVIGLLSALAWVLRRYASRIKLNVGQDTRMELQSILYLDPRHKLVMVRAGNREYVLMLGAQHSLLVDSRDVPPTPAP